MEDIGLLLKETREQIGVTIMEVATDLKLSISQVENLEAGKKDEFRDISVLKSIIVDYSKYLGLNSEDMIDDFNEYLFDHTSRIPVEEIVKTVAEAIDSTTKEESKEIVSPYTAEAKAVDIISFKYLEKKQTQ